LVERRILCTGQCVLFCDTGENLIGGTHNAERREREREIRKEEKKIGRTKKKRKKKGTTKSERMYGSRQEGGEERKKE